MTELTKEQIAQGWILNDGKGPDDDKVFVQVYAPADGCQLGHVEDFDFSFPSTDDHETDPIGSANNYFTMYRLLDPVRPSLPSPPVERLHLPPAADDAHHALDAMYSESVTGDAYMEAYEVVSHFIRASASPLTNEPVAEVDANDHTMGGSLVFKGSRILVSSIVGWIRQGSSNEEIVTAYPDLTNDQIDGVRSFLDATNEPVGVMISREDIALIMTEEWNDICNDTSCHPLDISHGNGSKLFFKPSHWVDQIADRLSAAIGERG